MQRLQYPEEADSLAVEPGAPSKSLPYLGVAPSMDHILIPTESHGNPFPPPEEPPRITGPEGIDLVPARRHRPRYLVTRRQPADLLSPQLPSPQSSKPDQPGQLCSLPWHHLLSA